MKIFDVICTGISVCKSTTCTHGEPHKPSMTSTGYCNEIGFFHCVKLCVEAVGENGPFKAGKRCCKPVMREGSIAYQLKKEPK